MIAFNKIFVTVALLAATATTALVVAVGTTLQHGAGGKVTRDTPTAMAGVHVML